MSRTANATLAFVLPVVMSVALGWCLHLIGALPGQAIAIAVIPGMFLQVVMLTFYTRMNTEPLVPLIERWLQQKGIVYRFVWRIITYVAGSFAFMMAVGAFSAGKCFG